MTKQAFNDFIVLQKFYDGIPSPKYHNVDFTELTIKFAELQRLKDHLGDVSEYKKLVNAMSQVITKLENYISISSTPETEIWSNRSERGMNKSIPPILKKGGQSLPVEWTDKWGNTCSVSNGYWGAKNYRVMDALGYMFLLKEGGDSLPVNSEPIFNDLVDIEQLESQLNGLEATVICRRDAPYIRFTDEQFRHLTRLEMNSTEIRDLLLETSRVEFKLKFPVRLKSTGAKEKIHSMNYYSRFYEFRHADLKVKKNGVVLSRKYQVTFNTLLGQLTVNNLLAKFNDPIDSRLYLLPDSAQIFYRRALCHNNFKKIPYTLTKIAELSGLIGKNKWNLAATVEINILGPLREYGFVDSVEKVSENRSEPKYIIRRSDKSSSEK